MISHEHQCIFVHIPKTAGNSINRVFGIGWENHKDLQRYHAELPPEIFAGYFKFAIVRNPWDRLLSDYNYQLKKSRARASKLFVFAADGSKRNFAEWVETALHSPDAYEPETWGATVSPHIHRWSPQLDWITVDGEVRTDYVARLERLMADFRVVCQRLEMPPVRLPHRNRRLHWHYSHYYDRSTRDLVAAYYARDIDAFGYEFEQTFLRVAVSWPWAPSHRAAPAQTEETTEPARCTVSFATARPPTRRRFWRRHPGLAAVVCAVLLFGVLTPSYLAATTSIDTSPSAQQSIRRLLVRANAPVASDPERGLMQRVRRFGRSVSDLKLQLELVPIDPTGAMLTLAPAEPLPARARGTTGGTAVSPSGSTPAPRWWFWRSRANHTDE